MKGATIAIAFCVLGVLFATVTRGTGAIPLSPTPREFPSRVRVVYQKCHGQLHERDYRVKVDANGLSEWFIHETSDGKLYLCQLIGVLLQ